MYACMYAYIRVCMHLCVYTCMYIGMHVCIHVYMHVIFKLGFERYGRGIVLVGRGIVRGREMSVSLVVGSLCSNGSRAVVVCMHLNDHDRFNLVSLFF